jgi:hypothetical protein
MEPREASVTANRRHLNLEIIQSNLSEAIEELETLRDRASSGELSEADLQVRLCQSQFNRRGKYPTKIETL